MICPGCGLENPSSALYCDCGREFVAGSNPKGISQPSGSECPKCNALSPVSNQFCGKCGAAMHRKSSSAAAIVLLGLVCTLLYVMVGNRGTESSPSAPPSARTPSVVESQPKECLAILNRSGSYNEYSTTITGSIKNNCGRRFRYVSITFKLKGSSGESVGNSGAQCWG